MLIFHFNKQNSNLNSKLKVVRINNMSIEPQIMAISNLGQASKTAKITFKVTDQTAWLFGSASAHDSNYMCQIGTSLTYDYNFGKSSLSLTHSSNYNATFTTPAWFRGVIISYDAFNISIV